MTETRSKIIADVVELPPQNVITKRILPDDAAKLAARDLVKLLHKTKTNALPTTINGTHHAELIILAELFNIVPKATEQK